MSDLKDEIAAFEAMRAEIEPKFLGKWAVVHDRKLDGAYDSFEEAAREAVERHGRGPYLIRQIGAPATILPASVMYHLGA